MIIKANFSNGEYYPISLNKNKSPKYLPLKFTILFLSGKAYQKKYNSINAFDKLDEFLYDLFKLDINKLIINDQFNTIIRNLKYISNWLLAKQITKSSINTILFSIKEFLLWASSVYSNNHSDNDFRIKSIIEIQTFEIKTKRLYRESLTKEKADVIFNLLSLENEQNPFTPQIRIRNLLIIYLFYETGIRKSELLKIKNDDFIRDGTNFYLQIKKREFDTEDTRKIKPLFKNIYSERIIGISPSSYLLFEKYIKTARIKGDSSYLFTSKLRKPLSKSMLNKIFTIISDNVKFKVSPHMFRHHFSERMLQFLIEIKKIDMERAKDELRVICGWSNKSLMPNYYSRKYIQVISNDHNIERTKKDNELYNT